MEEKKSYTKPKLNIIKVDREIQLQLVTVGEDNPPNPSGDTSTSQASTSTDESTEEPLKTNNFEENPFQR